MDNVSEQLTEYLIEAKSEVKRAEHLIYVSLKYTRTVDVFKSIIERFQNTFDVMITALLRQAVEEKKLAVVPPSSKVKCDALLRLYEGDAVLAEHIAFYLHLRNISRARYTKKNEYRRHVTMTAILDNDVQVEVTMEVIHDYFEKVQTFFSYAEQLLRHDAQGS